MGKFAHSPRHFAVLGLRPKFLILLASCSETSPKEEPCSFQVDALYSNKIYETEFTKSKRAKTQLCLVFFFFK